MITGIAHICFTVSDLDRSIAFYQEGLGFTHAFDFLRETGERRGCYLHIGGRNFIEMFVGEVQPPAQGQAYRHFCLEVDDIQATAAELRARGLEVVICSHALSGVERSLKNKFGTIGPVELMAYCLRLFGQGIKVAVEIAVMAADCAVVPTSEDIVAIGGSGTGADAAVVLKAAHQNNFFDLRVREIIAMVRG